MKKRTVFKYIAIVLSILIIGCLAYYQAEIQKKGLGRRSYLKEKIVLLYTNDVHCAVDKYVGYAGVAAYKKKLKTQNDHVLLVDCGDAIQGEYIGTISEGKYIADIMNKTGYDLAVCGNHDFAYGMKSISSIISNSKAKYINSNITYEGNNTNMLSQTASYTVIAFGETKIGFVGITTPSTTSTSIPACFMEDGKFVYNFQGKNNGKDLFEKVQQAVNACKRDGADYVIALSHLGVGTGCEPFSSTNLIANTVDIDIVLDAHSHTTIPCAVKKNKADKDVILTSTGEKLRAVGVVTISSKGIFTELKSDITEKDPEVSEYIANIKKSYDQELRKVVGTSDTLLSCYNENYVRIVRNRETNIGDFICDALLHSTEGDIAVFNGGSIRGDLPQGEITLRTLNSINGFNNMIYKTRVTGQEIMDMLEMSYRKTMPMITNDGKWSVGENGGFLQLSGLKCAIDTSIPTSVITDDNGMFVKVGEWRRVKDIMVKNKEGIYEPIEPQKSYVVVSTDYLIKESGDGISNLSNHEILLDGTISVTQSILDYFKSFNGNLNKYAKPDGRIKIK